MWAEPKIRVCVPGAPVLEIPLAEEIILPRSRFFSTILNDVPEIYVGVGGLF